MTRSGKTKTAPPTTGGKTVTGMFHREAAQAPRMFTDERLTSAISGQVAIEHYHRYFLARDYCHDKDVLDIAAGEGYGSALLAQVARSVVGVEIDGAVVEAATSEFQKPNLRYLAGDARKILLPDASVDVVVSFKTYENFAEHEAFLAETARVLRPGGLLIISTLDKDINSGPGIAPDPYHVREVTLNEFKEALLVHYPNVAILRQRALVGSFLDAGPTQAAVRHFEARGGYIESSHGLVRAPYLIAFASAKALPATPSSLFIETSDIHAACRTRAELDEMRTELDKTRTHLNEQSAVYTTHLSAALAASADVEAELARLKRSASWQISAPLRHVMTRYPGAGRRLRQAGKLVYWAATGQLVRRLKASVAYRRTSPDALSQVVDARTTHFTAEEIVVFLDQYLNERWPGKNLAVVKQAVSFASARTGSVIAEEDLAEGDVAVMIENLKTLASATDSGSIPDVSIIVPVHSALAHTLACLFSILASETRYRIEVLVGDDASTDATPIAISAISGAVRLVRHEQNLGFVRNCNVVAAAARGRFLVFLNNDTVVLPGWLDQLIEPLATQPEVGITCSKLLNADGTLQEAGGIFWQDGSAWNYGRGADPRAYPFNFVRDVDYGSGAAIAVSSDLWTELGGFDEQFAPAYCEDADLAFAVRAKGYRTLYIPTAEVIHHEGVSHGRDTSQGIKAHQIENLEKLRVKWSAALESHFPNGERVALAASRSQTKPRVLMIDHYVPQPDRDAGSRAMDCYLRLLVASGAHVTFWPENLALDRVYGPTYQKLGVELIYGGFGALSAPESLTARFEDWITARGMDFTHVIMSRPHVAAAVLPHLRRHTKARLLFIGHDLHGDRLRLEKFVSSSSEIDEEIKKADAMEAAVWNAVDVIFYPSSDEAEKVAAHGVRAQSVALPLFFYGEADIATPLARATLHRPGRPQILFVGGFPHRPNVDGVLWFCREIWPLVLRDAPGARLSIVGNAPPPDIVRLADSAVTITGFLSDAALEQQYGSADLVIAPLRFGAGVKGKVLEALLKGVPTVITTVAAQGIPGVDRAALIANEPEAFASAVLRTLTPGQHRLERVIAGQEIIREQYSQQVVKTALKVGIPELD
jgi:GT2 family glycosyltransferase/SAM-dependent methyltransferase/glycosyltransferase involved in cell wall biosynthesis